MPGVEGWVACGGRDRGRGAHPRLEQVGRRRARAPVPRRSSPASRQRRRAASEQGGQTHEGEPHDRRGHADGRRPCRRRRAGDGQLNPHAISSARPSSPAESCAAGGEARAAARRAAPARRPARTLRPRDLAPGRSSSPHPASSARQSIRITTTRRWLPDLTIGMWRRQLRERRQTPSAIGEHQHGEDAPRPARMRDGRTTSAAAASASGSAPT